VLLINIQYSLAAIFLVTKKQACELTALVKTKDLKVFKQYLNDF